MTSSVEESNNTTFTWQRILATNPPKPRSGAASVIIKTKLVIFGGYGGGSGRLDDFYSYDFNTCQWEEVKVLSDLKPGCRENNGVVIGDASRLYLFGGYNGSSWLNDLWAFDVETSQWELIDPGDDDPQIEIQAIQPQINDNVEIDPFHPLNRNDHGGIGFAEDASSSHNSNNNERPSRRFGYVSVVHKNKFICFGGFDGSQWLNDMYEFSFTTKTWKKIQAHGALPSVRSCPGWAKDDRYVYIIGGYDGVDRKADFFACDLETYTWHEMPNRGTPPSPRYFHSCCIYGNKMYVYGGFSGSERLADMKAYDFETNHWSDVDCSQGERPSGRSSLVCQVYDNSLYAFGGYNGSHVLNDFYRFRLKPVAVAPPSLINDMKKLMNNVDYADVSFLVEGQLIYANKSVLAVRSEYFNAMFFNQNIMRESLASNVEEPIPLEDISHSVFLKLLEYIYTDSITNMNELTEGIPLLIVSERFSLERLKSLCEDFIRKEITTENVIEIFIASHRHNASSLKDLALEFILRHLDNQTIINGLYDLKAEPDLLVEIIKKSRGSMFHLGDVDGGVDNNESSQHGPSSTHHFWSGSRR